MLHWQRAVDVLCLEMTRWGTGVSLKPGSLTLSKSVKDSGFVEVARKDDVPQRFPGPARRKQIHSRLWLSGYAGICRGTQGWEGAGSVLNK